MSDLMVVSLFIVGGLAVFTSVVAVLTSGRLFRADPPEPRRSERRITSDARR